MKTTKKNSVLVAVLLLVAMGNVCGMDSPFPLTDLPRDLQKEIMIIMANNEINNLPKKSEFLKVAAQKIKDLALVNKEFNEIINQPAFTLKMIKNFAKAFNTSDEAAAKAIATKGAQERIKLQDELNALMRSKKISMDKFEELCRRGVDLEFVNKFNQTPLFLAAVLAKDPMVTQALIKKGVNVNQTFGGRSKNTVLFSMVDGVGSAQGDERNQWLKILNILIDAGADPKFSEPGEPTALEIAEKYDQKDVIDLMKK